MKHSATITANPETDKVFTLNTNEDGTPKLGKDGKKYGFFRIEQKEIDLTSAVASVRTRSALKAITEESFEACKDVLTAGTVVKGKIIAKESLIKEQGYTEKRAGQEEDAPICTLGNQPIYRTTVYTENMEDEDVLIQHDNTEEIKAFQATLKVQAINA